MSTSPSDAAGRPSAPPADLVPGRAAVAEIDAALEAGYRRRNSAGRQIALLSVLAIAARAREVLPGAAEVLLAPADDGTYRAVGFADAAGQWIGYDPDASAWSADDDVNVRVEELLDDVSVPYCSNLDGWNSGTWDSFGTRYDRSDRVLLENDCFRLFIPQALTARPRIPARPRVSQRTHAATRRAGARRRLRRPSRAGPPSARPTHLFS